MYGYVYLTTNLVNGKKYIGKKSSQAFDTSYLGSGKLVKRAIKKYGRENFKCEILAWCSTEDELNQSERYFIQKFDAQERKDFYNISEGGDWGDVTKGMTSEEYAAWKEKINPRGRHHSEETKAKMSKARTGIVFSAETLEKMRQNNLGERNNMYGTKWSDDRKARFIQILNKPVEAILPDGTKVRFGSVKECEQYFLANYHIGDYTVKKLLHDTTPLHLSDRNKNRHKYVYAMNGLTIRYIDKE